MLRKIRLGSEVGIFLRDGIFSTFYGIVNLHPTKGTHCVCYIKDCYFDSYGCTPPKKLLRFIKSKHGKCIYSEYQIQRNDSFCGRYVFYVIYSTKVVRIDSKCGVLNLY